MQQQQQTQQQAPQQNTKAWYDAADAERQKMLDNFASRVYAAMARKRH